MADLSVLIPARNEEWLGQTVADVLAHTSERTDVIVVLDGAWPKTPLEQHKRVQVVYLPEPIGQRAATNLAARVSTAPYICKLDAHCAVAPGFDVALLEAAQTLGRECVQIPAQFNLHVFDWVCDPCRFKADQSPALKECPKCKGPLRKELVWKSRRRTRTEFWRFDSEPKFNYWNGYKERTESQGDICDVMTSLGACFFMSRDWFLEWGGLDERGGIWGNYGIEIACKAWLSGGRHVVNKRTFFSHFFRVGGHGFPYELRASQQQAARDYSRDMWFNNKWSGQVRPLSWLLERFWPVPGWTDSERSSLPSSLVVHASSRSQRDGAPCILAKSPTKSVIYYSDCRPDAAILEASRASIERSGLPIVAVTLEPIHWPAAKCLVYRAERGILTMFRQILMALEASTADVVFFAEHDLIYHESHWDFTPTNDKYWFNLNIWKVDAETGRAITYDTKQTSGLCANRALLVQHYRRRVARVEREGFSRQMGFEPGSHRRAGRVDDVPSDTWRSACPNVDIRHSQNLTATRWSPEQFRDQRHCQNWQESDSVPGWGQTLGRFPKFLRTLTRDRKVA